MSGAGGGLRGLDWQSSYSHEDGDLVASFFVPALSRSRLYQRVTGYFSADVLALAARGLEALLERGGRMELVVGCTLNPREVAELESGYRIREVLEREAESRLTLSEPDPEALQGLGTLARMVATGQLDLKVAIPKDAQGRFRAGLGIYHAKSGLLTDPAGDRLLFTGSVNETPAGWRLNCESFTVHGSWWGGRDPERIEKTAADFAALWTNRARGAEVLEFPEAARRKLLEYLPRDERAEPPPSAEPAPAGPSVEELRRRAWVFIRNAARRPDGAGVAVATSAITPWPHQLRAYDRMLREWPCRLLIADEVGLGKTIEAGLLIRHAWISGLAKRVLLLVPKAVLPQWQSELYEKFNLLVPIYTGSTLAWPEHHFRRGPLEEKVAREAWTRQPIVLASSHLVRRAERTAELLEADPWDLLLLDEAHHARRRGAGTTKSKGPNRLLALMQKLRERTRSLLLLSATPMQVHPVELWDLLQLLGLPSEWAEPAFLDYFEAVAGNPDDGTLKRLATLFQASEREFGKLPDEEVARVLERCGLTASQGKNLMRVLRDATPTVIPFKRLPTEERKAAVAVLKVGSPVRSRMSRHTRTLLREYHRRGLLRDRVAERDPEDVAVALNPGERALYEAVEKYISRVYQAANRDQKTAVGFVMTVYRRRLASSFFALRRTLQRRLEALEARAGETVEEEDLPQDERADETLAPEEAEALSNEALAREERDAIRELLRQIGRLGTDTKARELAERLGRCLDAGHQTAIVFTQYADTMEFLRDELTTRLEVPIGCFSGKGGQWRSQSGAWSSCSKERIKSMFRKGEIRVLLCTDAAAEGLNLQTCGALFNYDLPWNPMKVEQRIGRVDRIGQMHERIKVVNLAYQDTVEADVYFALSQRIQLFQGVVGRLQPILSQLPREFESAILAAPDQRERARHEVVNRVSRMVDEAEREGFDIDEVGEGALRFPELPASPLRPAEVELVLHRPDLVPPGFECHSLGDGTVTVQPPGDSEKARVTTRPNIFDEHFESLQLLLPDAPLFRRMADAAGVGPGSDEIPGEASIRELLEG